MIKPQDTPKIFPKEFLQKMSFLLGEEFDEFLTSLHQSPSIGLRVNTLKISAQQFYKISPFELSQVPWCITGFTINNPNPDDQPPGKHIYHIAGIYYLQEPSAMAAAEILSPRPGEKVLDLSAAPGGKSTHLAALMENSGLLVTNEIHPKRVWDLAENLERCGVINAVVTNETPQRLSDHFGEFFDRVMLDAPCSGEGMFRKSIAARKEWKAETPQSCSLRQYAILEQAAHMVMPGGCIAYTTCTFSPNENESIMVRFLENHPEFNLLSIVQRQGFSKARPDWVGLPEQHWINRAVRIWPHRSPGEGHFIALMMKTKSDEKISQPKAPIHNTNRQANYHWERTASKKIFDDFIKTYLNLYLEERRLYLHGTYVYYVPEYYPNLQGLKKIHPGWWLGSIHKSYYSPSHALAMGINQHQAKSTITFNLADKEVNQFIGGQSINNSGLNDWVLITVDGFPIGWGKRVQNVIKNYYPHGLRTIL